MWSVGVVGLIVLSVVPALPAAASSVQTRPRHAADSGSLGLLVLHPGDTVKAGGEVVSIPGRPVRFCAPVPEGGSTWGNRIRWCPVGIDVTGVDLSKLSHRTEKSGRVSGWATLKATYAPGELTVVEQRAYHDSEHLFDFSKVPCSPPAGGWPRGRKNDNLLTKTAERYRHRHPGSIIDLAFLRPSQRQVLLYVLTRGAPAPVRSALRRYYGKRLCVVRSHFSQAQISHGRHVLIAAMQGPHPMTSPYDAGGPDLRQKDDQPQDSAAMPRISAWFARQVDALPRHLARVTVWLGPYR
jgi:hypothetical protein